MTSPWLTSFQIEVSSISVATAQPTNSPTTPISGLHSEPMTWQRARLSPSSGEPSRETSPMSMRSPSDMAQRPCCDGPQSVTAASTAGFSLKCSRAWID